MRITNIQKKELSKIAKQHKLNLIDFEIFGQFKEFKIKYKYNYFSFSIDRFERENYKVLMFPIDNTNGISLSSNNWIGVTKLFNKWAKDVAEEITTPTGWRTFQSDNFLNSGFKELNEEFSESEKAYVRESIKELKQKINTLELSEQHLLVIERKLDELSDKVESLNKFDWKALFIGTIITLIMTLVIPPEISGLLWDHIKLIFARYNLNI